MHSTLVSQLLVGWVVRNAAFSDFHPVLDIKLRLPEPAMSQPQTQGCIYAIRADLSERCKVWFEHCRILCPHGKALKNRGEFESIWKVYVAWTKRLTARWLLAW